MKDLGVRNYKIVELDSLANGQLYQNALNQISGQRTVPNIFIGGQHLGGCDDTIAARDSGKLVSMLNDAGVSHKSSADNQQVEAGISPSNHPNSNNATFLAPLKPNVA